MRAPENLPRIFGKIRTSAIPEKGVSGVVWVGVEKGKDEIVKLQEKVEKEMQKIGFSQERGFVPHLTIARVRTARQKDRLASFVKEMSAAEFGAARAMAIELKQSTLTPKGPIYSTLAKVELG